MGQEIGWEGWSGRSSLVMLKLWSWIQNHEWMNQWMNYQGKYRAARAAKKLWNKVDKERRLLHNVTKGCLLIWENPPASPLQKILSFTYFLTQRFWTALWMLWLINMYFKTNIRPFERNLTLSCHPQAECQEWISRVVQQKEAWKHRAQVPVE